MHEHRPERPGLCADLGVDYQDVYEQRAEEAADRVRLGIHGGITNGGSDIDLLASDEPEPEGNL